MFWKYKVAKIIFSAFRVFSANWTWGGGDVRQLKMYLSPPKREQFNLLTSRPEPFLKHL